MSASLLQVLTRSIVIAGLLACGEGTVGAQTLTEYSVETRFQLDLHVSDAALAAFIPAGWTLNVATQGPAKDANLRAIFVDRVTITGPDGKPVGKGSNRLVYLAAPVKDPAGAAAQLMIGGITEDPADAPGPFGVYLLATTHKMQRTVSADTGPIVESQDWVFTAASGEHSKLHVAFERGAVNKSNPSETKFYSAKTPTVYQVSKQEQALDILRNVTTNPPDRVKKSAFTGSGGVYARLFDGTERLLSWDHILWINRSVLVP